MTARIPGHPRQYAMIGDVYVPDTKLLDDDAVLRLAGTYVEASDDPVIRHDHCPTCQTPSPCAIRRGAYSTAAGHRVKVTRRPSERL